MDKLVFIKKEEVFTDSKTIADQLQVRHKDLLKTIDKITKKQGDSRHPIFEQKFVEEIFTNKMGRDYRGYLLNEPAFSKLVMHLSGYERAEIVQDAFIEQFFLMRQSILNNQNMSWISKRESLMITRREETDTIKEFVEYAKSQCSKKSEMYYLSITKMTNKALELLIAVPHGGKIRDLASVTQLGFIQVVDDRAEQSIKYGMETNMHYREIYYYAKEQVNDLVNHLSFTPKKELVR